MTLRGYALRERKTCVCALWFLWNVPVSSAMRRTMCPPHAAQVADASLGPLFVPSRESRERFQRRVGIAQKPLQLDSASFLASFSLALSHDGWGINDTGKK